MKKNDFNTGWKYRISGTQKWKDITLPHDAVIGDERTEMSPGEHNTSWFINHDYEYEKVFESTGAETEILDFEGVYRDAVITLNGEEIASHAYGYTEFYVDLTGKLKNGENTLHVLAQNSKQPCSRWYTGAGIYRPVTLWTSGKSYIVPDGIKVTTVSLKPAKISVSVETVGEGPVTLEVSDGGKAVASVTTDERCAEITIDNARLWSDDSPNLYTLKATFAGDESEINFGVRTVSVNTKEGFLLNGKRVILKGGCIHHDNGILGSATHTYADERRIRLLREAGYNAIRCAHNPCSKAILNACDKYGMLVLDELYDGWYIHKTKYDYADLMLRNWEGDMADMVRKDFSHPSVVMYSIGNEVGETAHKQGIEMTDTMVKKCHELDGTRPVTCGVNIFFNFLNYIGFGVYSDKKADKEVKPGKKKKAVGSEFFNNLSGLLGAGFMKFGATLHGSNVRTRGAYANMDIAGYNYGINRYKGDLKKYPDRVILGSETFCVDAYKAYELEKANPAIIGDFVWAAMDYLGEDAIGSWEYKEYAPTFSHDCGWMSAGSGALDLLGNPTGEMLYTRVAYEYDKIRMGVQPVTHTGESHSPSSWRFTNTIESWTWNGCEGKKAYVEVYARAAKVALFLNGNKVGEKKMGKNCIFAFNTTYEPGELKAVAYDGNGREIANEVLKTGGSNTVVTLEPELDSVTKDDLCYVKISLSDGNGYIKPAERDKIKLSVTGGEILACGSACPYYADSYVSDVTDTYYGEALVIIRPTGEKISVSAESKKYGKAECEVTVKQ